MKKLAYVFLCLILILPTGCQIKTLDQADSGTDDKETSYLTGDDWSGDVKEALTAFIRENGSKSTSYDDTAYVVFDFDNTTSVFDVEEQLAIYQLTHMAFAIEPEQLKKVLATDLTDPDYGNGSYRDWISDITAAYERLASRYGQFSAKGLSEEESLKIQEDDDWKEFATKMRALYDVIFDHESAAVAYPWITYWFTGMTEEEIYDLAYRSHSYFSKKETTEETWKSPENYESKIGTVEYTWTSGISVTENVKELMKAFKENGIHVWICSASHIDVIRAGVDAFGLHDYVTGILAMTDKIEDGRVVNVYDYDSGCAYLTAEGDKEWKKDSLPSGAQTQGEGKVTAILNVLCKKYGHGPAAGFMDSTGDFNFCTEFASLKLVVCFNRANRKITDGGGLIAEVAMYQKDSLGYDLDLANENGDTFYVLQGRDENGMRTLRSSNRTIRFSDNDEKLFAGEDNEKELLYMADHHLTTKEAVETFAIKTGATDPGNLLGPDYGFLEEYRGYHAIDTKQIKNEVNKDE